VSDDKKKDVDPDAEGEEEGEEKEKPTKLGKFIQTYSAFLSSFVIGVAGLIATSIWQYRQSEIARRQAEAQQKVAETQANNSWRIERAEILAKNLEILSSHNPTNVDQRYGVLLSLTRGAILDPELAVSYALELGKDNSGYMRSVLASTADKNYVQLAHAFQLTCIQRFGVSKDVEVCKNDRYGDRSDAIAGLLSDEMMAATQNGSLASGPIALLKDERQVQTMPAKLSWLFEPYLTELYERRQWNEVKRFEDASPGARLVAALVLATARTGEFVTSAELAQLERLHADRRKWLITYLFGPSCDSECRGKLVDTMLSVYGEAQGDYDEAMKKLLQRPRGEAGPAVARLHQRLLWCQVDGADLAQFRDAVLVSGLEDLLGQSKPDQTMVDDLSGLLAMTPDPTDPAALTRWKTVLAKLQKLNPERYQKAFVGRRNIAERERRDPPPAMRKLTFCNAAASIYPTPPLPE
jgi:hypothetical protein